MNTGRFLEPLWWGLFSAGGVVAAFLVPVHIALTGLAVPLGWVPQTQALFQNSLVKLYLFVLISLPLFHWAHRFQYALVHMGLASIRRVLAVACYGSACVGTIAAAWILSRL